MRVENMSDGAVSHETPIIEQYDDAHDGLYNTARARHSRQAHHRHHQARLLRRGASRVIILFTHMAFNPPRRVSSVSFTAPPLVRWRRNLVKRTERGLTIHVRSLSAFVTRVAARCAVLKSLNDPMGSKSV